MTAGDELLRVSRSCAIPVSELTWRFTTSSGPGGQHANRSRTAVEVTFDVVASPLLGPRQRARLLERLGPAVTARSSDERSQLRNRELALERLGRRLAAGLAVERPRVATRPAAGARRERVRRKRIRGEVKRLRARPDADD